MRAVPRRRAIAVAMVALLIGLSGALTPGPAAATTDPVPTLQPLEELLPEIKYADSKCPVGYKCKAYKAVCDWGAGVRKTKLWIAENKNNPGYVGGTREFTVEPRGVAVFFSGGSGKTYWYPEKNTSNQYYVNKMMDAGIYVVDLRWNGTWNAAPSGDRSAGFDDLACRSSEVVKHVYQNIYVPKVLTPGNAPTTPFECGFCVSGYSAGTAEAVYSISHYTPQLAAVNAVPDAVVIASGPIYTALDLACQGKGVGEFKMAPDHYVDVDESYGYIGVQGPCANTNPAGVNWPPKWRNDGIANTSAYGATPYGAPQGTYNHPDTRIEVLLGAVDNHPVWHHSEVWQGVVEQYTAGCDFSAGVLGSHCFEYFVPYMSHSIKESPLGMLAMTRAITWPTAVPPPS